MLVDFGFTLLRAAARSRLRMLARREPLITLSLPAGDLVALENEPLAVVALAACAPAQLRLPRRLTRLPSAQAELLSLTHSVQTAAHLPLSASVPSVVAAAHVEQRTVEATVELAAAAAEQQLPQAAGRELVVPVPQAKEITAVTQPQLLLQLPAVAVVERAVQHRTPVRAFLALAALAKHLRLAVAASLTLPAVQEGIRLAAARMEPTVLAKVAKDELG
jgi:hypothetical protein